MSKITITESKLNEALSECQNWNIPVGDTVIVHLKGCNKEELKALAEKLNIKIITPENNLFSDSYTLKVDVNTQLQILMHSPKELFCSPPDAIGLDAHPMARKFN